jgi:hypothetical protein
MLAFRSDFASLVATPREMKAGHDAPAWQPPAISAEDPDQQPASLGIGAPGDPQMKLGAMRITDVERFDFVWS